MSDTCTTHRSRVPLPSLLTFILEIRRVVRRGERKGDGKIRRDRGERGKKIIVVRFPDKLPFGRQTAVSLAVPCDGTGHLWWTVRRSSASWRTAVAPPVEGSRQRVPRSLLLPRHGGRQQALASRRTALTPPLPLRRQPPLLDLGAQQRDFRPTCSSIAPAPPLRAATGGLCFFLLHDLLSTAIPPAARAL